MVNISHLTGDQRHHLPSLLSTEFKLTSDPDCIHKAHGRLVTTWWKAKVCGSTSAAPGVGTSEPLVSDVKPEAAGVQVL